MHKKRGQVAVFFIIGIVIIILVALIFVGRKEYGIGIPKTKFLDSKLKAVSDDVSNCVNNKVNPIVKRFSEQGGDLQPLKYVFYLNRKVKYLCYDIKDTDKCINMMPPLNKMIEGLNIEVDKAVKNCVNKNLIENGLGYEVIANGEPKSSVDIANGNLIVNVNYDVAFVKGDSSEKLGKITKEIDFPIVELYGVMNDIINSHAKDGFFEQLFYMLNKKGAYIINVDKSPSAGNVGDVIYRVNKKDSNFQFWFAIEGEQ